MRIVRGRPALKLNQGAVQKIRNWHIARLSHRSTYQLEQFRDFPSSLVALAETSELSYVATWLRALAQASECRLEVCLTRLADPLVLVRYFVTEKWTPALTFQATHDLPSKTPALLRQVYNLVGRVNFDGYGYAGGLLCPPDRYPHLGSYDEWRDVLFPALSLPTTVGATVEIELKQMEEQVDAMDLEDESCLYHFVNCWKNK